MLVRHLRLVVIASIGLWSSFALARPWHIMDESIEAEVFDVKGGIVRLQQPSGKIVAHHQSVLNTADRKYVDEWIAAESKIPLGNEILVSAKPYLETTHYVGNSATVREVLGVLIKVRGREAGTATCYRDLKVDDVVADDGTPLKRSAESLPDQRPVNLDRYGTIDQPLSGFDFKLIWDAPDKPVKSLRRLGGSFKIVTGTPRTITIGRIGTIENRRLDEPLLRQAGLTAIENPSPRRGGVFYDGQERQKQIVLDVNGPRDHVLSVELLDAKGQLVDSFSGHSTVGARSLDAASHKKHESTTYQFEFNPPWPADLRMRITILEDEHEVRIPFEISDLAISPQQPLADKPK